MLMNPMGGGMMCKNHLSEKIMKGQSIDYPYFIVNSSNYCYQNGRWLPN